MEYVKRTLLLSLPNLSAALLGIITLYVVPETQYWGRIVPKVIVSFLVASVLLHSFYKKGQKFVDKSNWHYGLVYSLPLIFHGLANTVLAGFDYTMITAYRSASETGIYSVAFTLGMSIGVIKSSMESVWIPWFTEHMNSNKKEVVNTMAQKYIGINTVLCICVMLCLPEVLYLFTDRAYWGGASLIPPIVLASFITILYSLSVDVEYYYKTTKFIAINTIIAAIVNMILNFLFIPKYGALAAAYTTVASYFLSFVLHYVYARRVDKELFPFSTYILPILLTVAGVFLASAISLWHIRWGIAFALLLTGGLYYKSSINRMISKKTKL